MGVWGEFDCVAHRVWYVHSRSTGWRAAVSAARSIRAEPSGSDTGIEPIALCTRSSHDGGAVGATRLRVAGKRGAWTRCRAGTRAGAPRGRCPVRAHRASATVARRPAHDRCNAGAQRPGGQVLPASSAVRVRSVDGTVHRHTSLACHTRPHQRPIGFGHDAPPRSPAMTTGRCRPHHTATSCLQSSISAPEFRGE